MAVVVVVVIVVVVVVVAGPCSNYGSGDAGATFIVRLALGTASSWCFFFRDVSFPLPFFSFFPLSLDCWPFSRSACKKSVLKVCSAPNVEMNVLVLMNNLAAGP